MWSRELHLFLELPRTSLLARGPAPGLRLRPACALSSLRCWLKADSSASAPQRVPCGWACSFSPAVGPLFHPLWVRSSCLLLATLLFLPAVGDALLLAYCWRRPSSACCWRCSSAALLLATLFFCLLVATLFFLLAVGDALLRPAVCDALLLPAVGDALFLPAVGDALLILFLSTCCAW